MFIGKKLSPEITIEELVAACAGHASHYCDDDAAASPEAQARSTRPSQAVPAPVHRKED